jgi:adenosylhomocysteine nucleosidase
MINNKRKKGSGQRMNKIGIIGAMEEEVRILKDLMPDAKVSCIAYMDFYEGTLEGKPVVVVRSGIGKVNAAICTQILADVFKVDAVINTGIAGSLRNEIDIADVVLSTDAQQHDMDATGFGYNFGIIPRMDTSVFAADAYLLDTAERVCKRDIAGIKAHKGRVLSGDQFISDQGKKEWLANTFGGFCTEMEGAAIAHAAYLNGIPFLIVRAISDKADQRAGMTYSEFEDIAIKNSVKLVRGILREI